ncbi:hypothetical protein F0562_023940 [Nyssa sinensis]|uniref:Uncharacterized protein n=1 Tax=Nyssa sinensis TaxID=561372 RepID=A0A5J5BJK3_9ASTE|nr:hypothetical protein F0562_023940 [Nyssa sinensis]
MNDVVHSEQVVRLVRVLTYGEKRKTLGLTIGTSSKRRVLIDESSSKRTILDLGVDPSVPEVQGLGVDNHIQPTLTVLKNNGPKPPPNFEGIPHVELPLVIDGSMGPSKRKSDSNIELAKANTLTEGLKKNLEGKWIITSQENERALFQSKLDRVKKELKASKSEIELAQKSLANSEEKMAAKVKAIKAKARCDQDTAVKMAHKFTGRGYNMCVKKLFKVFPDFDPERLDEINLTLEELEDDDD